MDALTSPSHFGEGVELWSDLFLQGGGQAGRAIRSIDWAATPLGPPGDWPAALKTAVSLMLNSSAPVYIAWGEELLSLYNDGYLAFLGEKPMGLGKPFTEVWAEIWEQFEPLVKETMAGNPQHFIDLPVALGGRPDIPLGYFTFSYTPLRDERGEVVGFYCASTETTAAVRARQVDHYQVELNQILQQTATARQAKLAVTELLGKTLGASRVLYAEPDLASGVFEATEFFSAPGVASFAGRFAFDPPVFERYARGDPIVITDVLEDEQFASEQERPEIAAGKVRAVLDIPLVREGQLRSVLSVHQSEPRRWTPVEIELATITAERSWELLDRAQSEEQLRRSEEQFRSTAEAVPGLLFVTDEEGRNLYVNRFYREYTGKNEGLSDKWWREVVHPDDLPAVFEAIKRCRRSGEDFSLDYRIRRHDGCYRWHSTNASPTRDDQGRIFQWVGVSLDTHDRRLAEEAARRAADEIEAISAPVGLTVLDRELRYVRINERLAEINGIPAADHIGKKVSELLPDVGANSEGPLRRVLAGEELWSIEIIGETPAMPGVSRTWRENWLPLRGPDGEITGIAVSAEEITSQKAAEIALATSEAQFRTLAEALPGLLFITTAEGGNSYVNETFANYAGLSKSQLLGTGWTSLLHPDDWARTRDAWRRAVSGNEIYEVEYRLRRHDGDYRWFAARALQIPTTDGEGRELWVGTCIDIHDRKTVEQEMRAAEERDRALFTSMEQGFCTIKVSFDDQGKPVDYHFTELNPAFSRQTGLAMDVLGKSVREAIPGLEEKWFERYGRIATTGQHERFLDRAEPLGRWFEVYGFRIGEPEDRNVAILFTDVTERVEQEVALRDSEQQLRLRLNAIPQMVWSTLPDGYHDFYNDRWYEFTGTPLGSTDGEGWNGMFHPDDQARAWQQWQDSLATGRPYEIEYRLRHHDGTYRWVLGRALPIRNETGDIVRWMGTCTDIDDRIAAAQALRQSEARLRAILEAVPVGLMFSDKDGRLTGSNERILEYLGHDLVPSATTTSYRDDYVAFHGDGRQVESEEYPLARALAGEERPELECRVRRGDGSLNWLRYVAAPIRDEGGNIVGGVVASIDIDREKHLTESLEREVEKVVSEREAAQEALRQSQKLESMGQLTGGVAHDFNNLLTPIIGSLDLLHRKQILDDRTGRLVEGALASAEKARVLVQRLLAFARRQPLKPQPIDLGRVVEEMSDLIGSTSGPRIRVVTDIDPDLPPALADGNQLEMALLNLSVNARDAMPDGGTLTIAARKGEPENGDRLGMTGRGQIVLSVSDTGVGMDEATRRRAIEPFFSTKGIGKGTGLGLSMVHGLAAQLGGALDIRSAPGVGTTIELWLPLATEKVASGEAGVGEADPHGAGLVLLVDDEELVRASTAGMLADLGYRVLEANSGEAAIALVEGGAKPELLVTDQLMPGVSGTDLAVRLRESFPKLPVLIVSGYADLDSLSPSFPHLSKPFRQAELAAALEKVTA